VWEAQPGDARSVDQAHLRMNVTVAGDRVTAVQFNWKRPEDFARERGQQNFVSLLETSMQIAVVSGMVIWGLYLLVRNIRHGLVRWRITIQIAVAAALATALGLMLARDRMLASYNTAIPLATYEALLYVSVALGAILAFLLLGGAAALVVSTFPESPAALGTAGRRIFGVDALAAVAAAAGLGLLLHQANALAVARFHAQALVSVDAPDLLASAAPAISALAGAVRDFVADAAMLAIGVTLWQRLPKWRLPLLLVTTFALVPDGLHTAGELALYYTLGLAMAGCIVLLFARFARGNFLAYGLILLVESLRGPLAELFGCAIPAVQMQGWVVAAVVTAGMAWAVVPALARERKLQTAGETA